MARTQLTGVCSGDVPEHWHTTGLLLMADLGSVLGSAGIRGAIGAAAGWTAGLAAHGLVYARRTAIRRS